MLDVLEVQDKLKSFSSYQLVQEMQMPTGRIPQFLVLSELNRRKDMKKDMAIRESADQPTVKEEVVAASGMPMANASEMAQQLAPQSSMTENTGIASMMPRELPSEEEPMRMSYGGMLNSRMVAMGQPRLMDYQENRHSPMGRRTFQSGLDNLGRDISGRVQGRTEEEVQDFVGEVGNMAQERFEVNLSEPSMAHRRQSELERRMFGGKGMPPRAIAMKDGGVIKAQSGMFADIAGGLGSIDNSSGYKFATMSPPDTNLFASSTQPSGFPSFASIYNWIKTNFPEMPDADAIRQSKAIQEDQKSGKIPTLDTTLNKGLPPPDKNLFASSLGTDPTYDQFKIKPPKYTPPSSEGVSGGIDFDATAPKISSDESGSGFIPTELENVLSPVSNNIGTPINVDLNDLEKEKRKNKFKKNQLDYLKFLEESNKGSSLGSIVDSAPVSSTDPKKSVYDPTIYGESQAELEAQMKDFVPSKELYTVDPDAPKTYYGYEPKTRFGKYFGQKPLGFIEGLGSSTYGGLERSAGGVRDFFTQPLVDGKPFSQSESLAQYVGLPASMVDEFNKNISEELRKKDEPTAKSERDFRKEQEKMIYEESMKKSNLLAEEEEKEEEKKKKLKKEEDRILGGFGKASGSLSDLSAQIAELKEKREKGRESEKWFSLAKLGLGMLASASPTVFGALGEGGLKALEDFKAGKKAYDDDILGYLKTQASIEKSQAELGLKGLVAQKQIAALKAKGLTGMTEKERTTAIINIDKELNDIYELGKYDIENPKVKRRIFDLETQKRMLQLGKRLGPTVLDKDLTATNVATS